MKRVDWELDEEQREGSSRRELLFEGENVGVEVDCAEGPRAPRPLASSIDRANKEGLLVAPRKPPLRLQYREGGALQRVST